MNGYDMVVALTQNLLNQQLAELIAAPDAPAPPPGTPPVEYPIESSFTMQLNPAAAPGTNGAWPLVHVDTMAAPTITILANGQLTLTLHLLEGYVQCFVVGSEETFPINNVDVSFTVDMTLDTINDPDSLNAPEVTKNQLNGFSSDDFTIQFLMLQFETATLMNSCEVTSENFTKNSAQYLVLMNCFAIYLSNLQQSDNPYILGYPIQSKNPAQTNPTLPEFAPTSCEFSTTLYTTPGLSTLNYGLMTQHRAFPTSDKRLIFDTPWMTDPSLAGTIVIDRQVFVSGYVVAYVLPQIKAALKISDNWTQSGNPNAWNIYDYKSNEDQNDGKGEIIDSDGLNVYRLQKQTTNCDVQLSTTGDIQITASGYFQVYIKEEQYAVLGYEKLGEAEYKQPWHMTLKLGIGVDGQFLLDTDVVEDALQTPIEPNAGFLESIGDWFANLFTGGDYTSIQEAVADKAQHMVASLSTSFDSAVVSDMDVLANQFVLPAGDVIYYNSLEFNSSQDMRSDIAGYQ